MTRWVLAAAFMSAACAPITFSEEAAIDFARYRTALIRGDGAEYLAVELNETSGFAAVTTDPSARVDLVIDVAVHLESYESCECDCSCDCACDCSCETEFEATASFVARTPAGVHVDSGSEDDISSYAAEARDDALDEVALHFIRAYRL